MSRPFAFHGVPTCAHAGLATGKTYRYGDKFKPKEPQCPGEHRACAAIFGLPLAGK